MNQVSYEVLKIIDRDSESVAPTFDPNQHPPLPFPLPRKMRLSRTATISNLKHFSLFLRQSHPDGVHYLQSLLESLAIIPIHKPRTKLNRKLSRSVFLPRILENKSLISMYQPKRSFSARLSLRTESLACCIHSTDLRNIISLPIRQQQESGNRSMPQSQ